MSVRVDVGAIAPTLPGKTRADRQRAAEAWLHGEGVRYEVDERDQVEAEIVAWLRKRAEHGYRSDHEATALRAAASCIESGHWRAEQRRDADIDTVAARMGVSHLEAVRALADSPGDVDAACDWLRRKTVMR